MSPRPSPTRAARRGAIALLAVAACSPVVVPEAAPAPAGSLAAAVGLLLPPAPTATLDRLVGVYADGADTVLVLEADGRLLALGADSARRPLQARGDGARFVAPLPDGDSVVVRAEASGAHLDAWGRRWHLADVAPTGGASFRIVPQRPVEELRREALAAVPPAQPDSLLAPELVELVRLDPTIRLDVRYATTDNFMGARFYDEPRAFLQRPAAEALVRAHRRLGALGYGLLVHDAYRPWYVTRMFWDATPPHQRDFVADPASGSRHNRGAAVDLTLYERATGRAVEMPSGYDEFTRRARADFPGGTTRQRALRALLRRAMEAEGFAVYAPEWWHFDHAGWRRYPVLNRPFAELGPGAA